MITFWYSLFSQTRVQFSTANSRYKTENWHNHSNFKHPAKAIRLFRNFFTLSPQSRAGILKQKKKTTTEKEHRQSGTQLVFKSQWNLLVMSQHAISSLRYTNQLDNNSSNGAYTARRWDFGLSITISHLFLRFDSTYNFCQIEGNVRGGHCTSKNFNNLLKGY